MEFFVGNFPSDGQMEKEGKLLVDYIKEWHDKYGPIIKVQILGQIVLATVDPLAIKVIVNLCMWN